MRNIYLLPLLLLIFLVASCATKRDYNYYFSYHQYSQPKQDDEIADLSESDLHDEEQPIYAGEVDLGELIINRPSPFVETTAPTVLSPASNEKIQLSKAEKKEIKTALKESKKEYRKEVKKERAKAKGDRGEEFLYSALVSIALGLWLVIRYGHTAVWGPGGWILIGVGVFFGLLYFLFNSGGSSG